MADNRNNELRSPAISKQKLTQHIKDAKFDIRILFLLAFGEGKSLEDILKITHGKIKPTNDIGHQVKIFNQLWEHLDAEILKVTTVDDFEKKYQDLDSFFDKYCQENQKVVISQKDKIKQIIEIHRVLSLQLFHLSAFKNEDDVENILVRVQQLDKKINESDAYNAFLYKEAISFGTKLTKLEQLLAQVNQTLLEKYNKHNSISFENHAMICDEEDLEFVQNELNKLPSAQVINLIVDAIIEELKQKDSKRFALLKEQIFEIILKISTVQEKLYLFVFNKIASLKLDLEDLLRRNKELEDLTEPNVYKTEQKYLKDFFANVLGILGYKDKKKDVKGLVELTELALAINQNKSLGLSRSAKQWNDAGDKTSQILLKLKDELQTFISPYKQLIIKAQSIKTELDSDQLAKRQSALLKVNSCLTNAEVSLLEAFQNLTDVQVKLLASARVIPEPFFRFIIVFLYKHAKEIILGGVGGGLTSLLSLLFSSTPAGWITLGVLLGNLVGALKGIGSDYLQERKKTKRVEEKKEEDEVKLNLTQNQEKEKKEADIVLQMAKVSTASKETDDDNELSSTSPLLSFSNLPKLSYGAFFPNPTKVLKKAAEFPKSFFYPRSSL